MEIFYSITRKVNQDLHPDLPKVDHHTVKFGGNSRFSLNDFFIRVALRLGTNLFELQHNLEQNKEFKITITFKYGNKNL